MDTYSENSMNLVGAYFAQGEEKEKKIKYTFEVQLPQFLEHYDKYFSENKTDFLFGDKPVTADF